MRGVVFSFWDSTKIPLFLNTHCLMVSLVECYKIVPWDIFCASDCQLKLLRNPLISRHFTLSNTTSGIIECFSLDFQIVLMMKKTRKSWSKLKLCLSVFLTEVVMWMLQGFLLWVYKWKITYNNTLIVMWKTQFYQGKITKSVVLFLNKSLYKFTADHISAKREKLLKKPKFDIFFNGIK